MHFIHHQYSCSGGSDQKSMEKPHGAVSVSCVLSFFNERSLPFTIQLLVKWSITGCPAIFLAPSLRCSTTTRGLSSTLPQPAFSLHQSLGTMGLTPLNLIVILSDLTAISPERHFSEALSERMVNTYSNHLGTLEGAHLTHYGG